MRTFLFVAVALITAPLTSVSPAAASTTSTIGTRAAQVALAQRGDPYVYGAEGPNAFDCSGLMYYAFAQVGKSIPRTAAAQFASATRISRSALRVGDLTFNSNSGRISHVAMYVGGGQVVVARKAGTTVTTQPVSYFSTFGRVKGT